AQYLAACNFRTIVFKSPTWRSNASTQPGLSLSGVAANFGLNRPGCMPNAHFGEGGEMKSIASVLALGCLSCLIAPAAAWAEGTAQISGTVRDASGAVLPGVQVTATQTETGITRMTLTNETGFYVLASLPLGPYRIESSLQGFRTFAQTGIVLQVGSSPVID